MAAEFSAEEIIAITGGRLAQGMLPDEVGPIGTDTREELEGAWYMALPGKLYDGHDFIGEAFSQGAIGCIVDERGSYAIASTSFPLIAVENTHAAQFQLARNWRRRINPRVVAITATQSEPSFALELCRLALSKHMLVYADEERISGGTVRSILQMMLAMPDDTQCLLVALAPQSAGESVGLAATLLPSVVILSADGYAHLRLSESEQGIVDAQCVLAKQMDKVNGLCVVGTRSPALRARLQQDYPGKTAYFEAPDVEVQDAGATIRICLTDPQLDFSLPKVDRFDLSDLWCALRACHALGIEYNQLVKAFQALEP